MSNIEKKPDRSAVSLRYDNRVNKSPVVTAKGKGLIAEKIISLAKENNVPIKEDPDLVQLLSQVVLILHLQIHLLNRLMVLQLVM